MLKLTWIEFFLRTIPEMFILIWGIHVISRKSVNMNKYIFCSLILSILTFFVRWLPIYFGVHMIINMILIISITTIIDIDMIKAIYGTLLIFFTLSLSEFFNILILSLLDINIDIQMLNPVSKCTYSLPSLIFLLVFIMIMKHLLEMKEGVKNISN